MGKYPKEKVPELYAAKRALIAYLKEHNIDPSDTKRIQTDPELKKLVYKLNKERDKVMANYPALDKSNNIKLLRMAKENKKAKKAKKVEEAEISKSEKKDKKSTGRTSTKYDYPQVKDEKTGKMRDMNSAEKKKYRMEQRKAANGGQTSKKEKTSKKEAPVKDKKAKDNNQKVKKSKAKNVKKDED